MHKKSQGMSINVVVAATLALIVLIVLIAIFYGKSGAFSRGVNDCEAKGGKCVAESDCGLGKLYICPNKGEVCCLSSCEVRGGICKPSCEANEEKVYLAECENNQECCTTKSKE